MDLIDQEVYLQVELQLGLDKTQANEWLDMEIEGCKTHKSKKVILYELSLITLSIT